MESLSFQRTFAWTQQALALERSLDELVEHLKHLTQDEVSDPALRRAQRVLQRGAEKREAVGERVATLPQSLPAPMRQWIARWDEYIATYQRIQREGVALFAEELAEKRDQLRTFVADPRYQEAIWLSSPDMYQNHMQKYLTTVDFARRSSELKRVEKRFFSYLQRLCGKNETASFFGPLNYGQIDDNQALMLDTRLGDGPIIRRREVFLTFWAVKALAEAIKQEEQLQQTLPLSLHPMVEIRKDGTLYLHNSGRSLKVGSQLIQLFNAMDGSKGKTQLLAMLPEEEQSRASRLIGTLIQSGVVRQELHVPSTQAHPLTALQAQLRNLPWSAVRQEWEERLECWQHWCDEMARADLPTRISLLEQGEERFSAQTGQHARRGSGNLYADRFIFYEETLGHVERFVMGKPFHEKMCLQLQTALQLSALQGWREWQYYQSCGKAVFAALSPQGTPLPFYTFLQALRERCPETPPMPPIPEQKAIEQLIAQKVEQGACHHVVLHAEELPSGPGNIALYSLPDLFFASSSLEALQRGEFQVVLGKLHHHLLVPNWMTCFYSDEERLRVDMREYLDTTFQRLVCPEVIRRNKGFYDFPGRVVEFSEHSVKPRDQIIPLYDIRVVMQPDGWLALERVSTGEPLQFYISLADQVRYLPFAIFGLPGLSHLSLSIGQHTPRIEIEGVVYQRERWKFASREWQEQISGDDLYNFKRLQYLKQMHGLPDQVYIRSSSERKPYLFDFRNFFCLELLYTILKTSEWILIEEMLPAPEHLWLRSEEGRYSCEFRMNIFRLEEGAQGGLV
jgi:hypothetical protein